MNDVAREDVIDVLRGHPEGLSVHEVNDAFDAKFIEVQNRLRQLYKQGEVEYNRPSTLDGNKRWRVAG